MSSTAASADETVQALKEQARRTWSAGNYDAVASGIWEVGAVIVDRAGITAGDRVLDVACGTGNAAIRAAQDGGRVVGLDLTPKMFEAARRRAAEAGVKMEWVEGDAEALPFADSSFDVVTSTFGVMFAPRHELAAGEMARVLRPGGRIGLATWTPEGSVGSLFAAVGAQLPPPPKIAQSPMRWGVEEHVREMFEPVGIEPSFERATLGLDPDIDVEEAADFYLSSFGPLVTARSLLEPLGNWDAFLAGVVPAIEGMMTEPAEYLIVTGSKRG